MLNFGLIIITRTHNHSKVFHRKDFLNLWEETSLEESGNWSETDVLFVHREAKEILKATDRSIHRLITNPTRPQYTV